MPFEVIQINWKRKETKFLPLEVVHSQKASKLLNSRKAIPFKMVYIVATQKYGSGWIT